MSAYPIGSPITAVGHGGPAVLARVTAPGIATCLHELTDSRQCGCPIQRSSTGSLAEGVRVHYRTVHPEKGVQ